MIKKRMLLIVKKRSLILQRHVFVSVGQILSSDSISKLFFKISFFKLTIKHVDLVISVEFIVSPTAVVKLMSSNPHSEK
jgi:hypothetical protein